MAPQQTNPNKKTRKNPINFDITLSDEQKAAKAVMLDSICAILDGSPGTSKSTLSMNVALDLLFRGDIHKIYCTRPPIELKQFSNSGALPGDEKQKNEAYMQPFMDAITANYGNAQAKKNKIKKCIEEDESIVFLPMPYLRGKNLGTKDEKVIVLVDESQSCDVDTMYAVLTRLGEGSRMFLTMDLNQADHKGKSGGERLSKMVGQIEGLNMVKLTKNYRSKFVQDINEHWFKF
jgi:phosphate starvation-inducible PhoH-like protein